MMALDRHRGQGNVTGAGGNNAFESNAGRWVITNVQKELGLRWGTVTDEEWGRRLGKKISKIFWFVGPARSASGQTRSF